VENFGISELQSLFVLCVWYSPFCSFQQCVLQLFPAVTTGPRPGQQVYMAADKRISLKPAEAKGRNSPSRPGTTLSCHSFPCLAMDYDFRPGGF